MARPRNQAARRAQILDSAVDAIRDRGAGNVRIRDVAEAAGVSAGTVHYYFDDLDRLLIEVHSKATDRFFAARMEAIADVPEAPEKLRIMVDSGLPTSRDDSMVVALYEIGLYKRADPVHALLSRGLFDRQVAVYHGVLELGRSQGHFRIDGPVMDVAQNLVALEDAYGMHIVSGNESLPWERSRQLILSYARCATSCTALESI